MKLIDFIISAFGFLPWYISLLPFILITTLWLLNPLKLWVHLRLAEKPFSKKQLTLLSSLILLISLISALPVIWRSKQNETGLKQRISELEKTLSLVVKGEAVEKTILETLDKSPDCLNWSQCSDFKNDTGLDNKYYRHTNEDPQKLILEGGPFANPPLYLEHEISPFYEFKLEVQPLDSDAANIFIESREMFQVFIGDNDYRSIAFLAWDQINNRWSRPENAKIYFGRDLNRKDLQPKTIFSIEVKTRKKGSDAEASFSLNYKSVDGKTETAKFSRIVNIPAAEPEKFRTKIGTGMFRPKGNIPQAKFYFMGVK